MWINDLLEALQHKPDLKSTPLCGSLCVVHAKKKKKDNFLGFFVSLFIYCSLLILYIVPESYLHKNTCYFIIKYHISVDIIFTLSYVKQKKYQPTINYLITY